MTCLTSSFQWSLLAQQSTLPHRHSIAAINQIPVTNKACFLQSSALPVSPDRSQYWPPSRWRAGLSDERRWQGKWVFPCLGSSPHPSLSYQEPCVGGQSPGWTPINRPMLSLTRACRGWGGMSARAHSRSHKPHNDWQIVVEMFSFSNEVWIFTSVWVPPV